MLLTGLADRTDHHSSWLKSAPLCLSLGRVWGGGQDGVPSSYTLWATPNKPLWPICTPWGGPWPQEAPQIHEWGRTGGAQSPWSNPSPSPDQGQSACEQIRAALYLECSAKFRENVEDVFREAAKVALSALKKAQRQKQHRLCLLP